MINTLKARRRIASPGRLYGSGRDKNFGDRPRRDKKATFCAATETSLGSTQEANSENPRSAQGRPQTRRNDPLIADFQDSDSGNEATKAVEGNVF